MNLEQLKTKLIDLECSRIYVKRLSPNDNSKNQIYFGGSFEVLNVFPLSEIVSESPGEWERERFKASMEFFWLTDTGELISAPNTQLILYPKYPEVRLSGFLKGCQYKRLSELLQSRNEGRILFLAITRKRKVIGLVTDKNAVLSKEFNALQDLSMTGLFYTIELNTVINSRAVLLNKLKEIHLTGWIRSKKLTPTGGLEKCEAPNCGGYTLEAELGIKPNGYAEPDYLGWEIKQFNVVSFDKYASSTITLMTPEPTGGYYTAAGANAFLIKYGYKDHAGRADRINFGGIYKIGITHLETKLRIELIGFDAKTNKIKQSNGKIALIDRNDNIAAEWNFTSMLKHWNRKHNQACYVPSIKKMEPVLHYHYGDKIILGTHTDFQLFLGELSRGNIYYDPGIKMEYASTARPKIKKRSQFRTRSVFLANLYHNNEVIDLNTI
ncbi:MAG: MvaI/BcnI restriction endonuclease family protein [Bacteroidales bacterium]|jgi:hypothetical protein|nr:MvaI/BcnI restriction endonuclease family protein [Bacteroidales bacterium]